MAKYTNLKTFFLSKGKFNKENLGCLYMALTEDQIQDIKKQILSQVESFPEDQREQAKQQIETMNAEQLEQFLIQNNLVKQPSSDSSPQGSRCVFCSIANKQAQSYIIDENKKALAVLEINPLSIGHSIIIPLEHTEVQKISSQALTLAKKIAKRIKTKLKPQDVKIETTNAFGHTIINVIPIYKDKKLGKTQAKPEELKKLQEKLKTKPRAPRKPKSSKNKKPRKLPKAPKRMP